MDGVDGWRSAVGRRGWRVGRGLRIGEAVMGVPYGD